MAAIVKSQKLVDDERLDITKWKEFTPHPAMTLLPHMREDEFEALKEDIAKNGVKIPILFTGTQLLDGLHRYVAWKELKMKERIPRVRYRGTDPIGEVLSRNLMRRHLTDDQRAFIVSEARREAEEAAAAARKGTRTDLVSISTQGSPPDGGRSHEKLAAAADVTPYKARQAMDVGRYATSEEKKQVVAGKARLKDIAPRARKRAEKTGKRKAKPKKEVDTMAEKYVVKKFKDFLNGNWGVTQHRAVKAIIRPLTADKP